MRKLFQFSRTSKPLSLLWSEYCSGLNAENSKDITKLKQLEIFIDSCVSGCDNNSQLPASEISSISYILIMTAQDLASSDTPSTIESNTIQYNVTILSKIITCLRFLFNLQKYIQTISEDITVLNKLLQLSKHCTKLSDIINLIEIIDMLIVCSPTQATEMCLLEGYKQLLSQYSATSFFNIQILIYNKLSTFLKLYPELSNNITATATMTTITNTGTSLSATTNTTTSIPITHILETSCEPLLELDNDNDDGIINSNNVDNSKNMTVKVPHEIQQQQQQQQQLKVDNYEALLDDLDSPHTSRIRSTSTLLNETYTAIESRPSITAQDTNTSHHSNLPTTTTLTYKYHSAYSSSKYHNPSGVLHSTHTSTNTLNFHPTDYTIPNNIKNTTEANLRASKKSVHGAENESLATKGLNLALQMMGGLFNLGTTNSTYHTKELEDYAVSREKRDEESYESHMKIEMYAIPDYILKEESQRIQRFLQCTSADSPHRHNNTNTLHSPTHTMNSHDNVLSTPKTTLHGAISTSTISDGDMNRISMLSAGIDMDSGPPDSTIPLLSVESIQQLQTTEPECTEQSIPPHQLLDNTHITMAVQNVTENGDVTSSYQKMTTILNQDVIDSDDDTPLPYTINEDNIPYTECIALNSSSDESDIISPDPSAETTVHQHNVLSSTVVDTNIDTSTTKIEAKVVEESARSSSPTTGVKTRSDINISQYIRQQVVQHGLLKHIILSMVQVITRTQVIQILKCIENILYHNASIQQEFHESHGYEDICNMIIRVELYVENPQLLLSMTNMNPDLISENIKQTIETNLSVQRLHDTTTTNTNATSGSDSSSKSPILNNTSINKSPKPAVSSSSSGSNMTSEVFTDNNEEYITYITRCLLSMLLENSYKEYNTANTSNNTTTDKVIDIATNATNPTSAHPSSMSPTNHNHIDDCHPGLYQYISVSLTNISAFTIITHLIKSKCITAINIGTSLVYTILKMNPLYVTFFELNGIMETVISTCTQLLLHGPYVTLNYENMTPIEVSIGSNQIPDNSSNFHINHGSGATFISQSTDCCQSKQKMCLNKTDKLMMYSRLKEITSDFLIIIQMYAVYTSNRDTHNILMYLNEILLTLTTISSSHSPILDFPHFDTCQKSTSRPYSDLHNINRDARDSPIVGLSVYPTYYCQNCDSEPAVLECIHEMCCQLHCTQLCRECDQVFHKAISKRGHIRLPIVESMHMDAYATMEVQKSGTNLFQNSIHECRKIMTLIYDHANNGIRENNPSDIQLSKLIINKKIGGVLMLDSSVALLLYTYRGLLDDFKSRNRVIPLSLFEPLMTSLRIYTTTLPSEYNSLFCQPRTVGADSSSQLRAVSSSSMTSPVLSQPAMLRHSISSNTDEASSKTLNKKTSSASNVLSPNASSNADKHSTNTRSEWSSLVESRDDLEYNNQRDIFIDIPETSNAFTTVSTTAVDGDYQNTPRRVAFSLFIQILCYYLSDTFSDKVTLIHDLNRDINRDNLTPTNLSMSSSCISDFRRLGGDALLIHLLTSDIKIHGNNSSYIQLTTTDKHMIIYCLRECIVHALPYKDDSALDILKWLLWLVQSCPLSASSSTTSSSSYTTAASSNPMMSMYSPKLHMMTSSTSDVRDNDILLSPPPITTTATALSHSYIMKTNVIRLHKIPSTRSVSSDTLFHPSSSKNLFASNTNLKQLHTLKSKGIKYATFPTTRPPITSCIRMFILQELRLLLSGDEYLYHKIHTFQTLHMSYKSKGGKYMETGQLQREVSCTSISSSHTTNATQSYRTHPSHSNLSKATSPPHTTTQNNNSSNEGSYVLPMNVPICRNTMKDLFIKAGGLEAICKLTFGEYAPSSIVDLFQLDLIKSTTHRKHSTSSTGTTRTTEEGTSATPMTPTTTTTSTTINSGNSSNHSTAYPTHNVSQVLTVNKSCYDLPMKSDYIDETAIQEWFLSLSLLYDLLSNNDRAKSQLDSIISLKTMILCMYSLTRNAMSADSSFEHIKGAEVSGDTYVANNLLLDMIMELCIGRGRIIGHEKSYVGFCTKHSYFSTNFSSSLSPTPSTGSNQTNTLSTNKVTGLGSSNQETPSVNTRQKVSAIWRHKIFQTLVNNITAYTELNDSSDYYPSHTTFLAPLYYIQATTYSHIYTLMNPSMLTLNHDHLTRSNLFILPPVPTNTATNGTASTTTTSGAVNATNGFQSVPTNWNTTTTTSSSPSMFNIWSNSPIITSTTTATEMAESVKNPLDQSTHSDAHSRTSSYSYRKRSYSIKTTLTQSIHTSSATAVIHDTTSLDINNIWENESIAPSVNSYHSQTSLLAFAQAMRPSESSSLKGDVTPLITSHSQIGSFIPIHNIKSTEWPSKTIEESPIDKSILYRPPCRFPLFDHIGWTMDPIFNKSMMILHCALLYKSGLYMTESLVDEDDMADYLVTEYTLEGDQSTHPTGTMSTTTATVTSATKANISSKTLDDKTDRLSLSRQESFRTNVSNTVLSTLSETNQTPATSSIPFKDQGVDGRPLSPLSILSPENIKLSQLRQQMSQFRPIAKLDSATSSSRISMTRTRHYNHIYQTSIDWQPPYSSIRLRHIDVSELLFSLVLCSRGDTQCVLLNYIAQMIDGNPENMSLFIHQTSHITSLLIQLLPLLPEKPSTLITQLISQILSYDCNLTIFQQLIYYANQVTWTLDYPHNNCYNPHSLISSSHATATILHQFLTKLYKDDTISLPLNDDMNNNAVISNILYILGKTSKRVSPSEYLHFSQSSPFFTGIFLPPLKKIPSKTSGYSICTWVRLGHMGNKSIMSFMQIGSDPTDCDEDKKEGTRSSHTPVIDIYFKLICKSEMKGVSGKGGLDFQPEYNKRIAQLCISMSSPSENPTKLTDLDTKAQPFTTVKSHHNNDNSSNLLVPLSCSDYNNNAYITNDVNPRKNVSEIKFSTDTIAAANTTTGSLPRTPQLSSSIVKKSTAETALPASLYRPTLIRTPSDLAAPNTSYFENQLSMTNPNQWIELHRNIIDPEEISLTTEILHNRQQDTISQPNTTPIPSDISVLKLSRNLSSDDTNSSPIKCVSDENIDNAKDASLGIISSLSRYLLPDLIIDYDWIEGGDWHLLYLHHDHNIIECYIDGDKKQIHSWSLDGRHHSASSRNDRAATANISPNVHRPASSTTTYPQHSASFSSQVSKSVYGHTTNPISRTVSNSTNIFDHGHGHEIDEAATTNSIKRYLAEWSYPKIPISPSTKGSLPTLQMTIGYLAYDQIHHQNLLRYIQGNTEKHTEDYNMILQSHYNMISSYIGDLGDMIVLEGSLEETVLKSTYLAGARIGLNALITVDTLLSKLDIQDIHSLKGSSIVSKKDQHTPHKVHNYDVITPIITPIPERKSSISFSTSPRSSLFTSNDVSTTNRTPTPVSKLDSNMSLDKRGLDASIKPTTMVVSNKKTSNDRFTLLRTSTSNMTTNTSQMVESPKDNGSGGGDHNKALVNNINRLYRYVDVHITECLATVIYANNHLSILYPLLFLSDTTTQSATLQVIIDLITSSPVLYDSFIKQNLDLIILYGFHMTPLNQSVSCIQSMYEAICPANSILSRDLIQSDRIRLLSLLFEVIVSNPNHPILARLTTDWLKDVCDDVHENTLQIIKTISMYSILTLLSLWNLNESMSLFSTRLNKVSNTANSPTSTSIDDIKLSSSSTSHDFRDATTKTKQDQILLSNTEKSRLQLSCGLFLKVLITGTTCHDPLLITPLSNDQNIPTNNIPSMTGISVNMMNNTLNTPLVTSTGFTIDHFLTLIHFLYVCYSKLENEEENTMKQKKTTSSTSTTTSTNTPRNSNITGGIASATIMANTLHNSKSRKHGTSASMHPTTTTTGISSLSTLSSPGLSNIDKSNNWLLNAIVITLDVIIGAAETVTGPILLQYIRQLQLNNTTNTTNSTGTSNILWNLCLYMLGSSYNSIRYRIFTLLTLSFSLPPYGHEPDPKMIQLFEKINGFQIMIDQLSKHPADDMIIDCLVTLLYWKSSRSNPLKQSTPRAPPATSTGNTTDNATKTISSNTDTVTEKPMQSADSATKQSTALKTTKANTTTTSNQSDSKNAVSPRPGSASPGSRLFYPRRDKNMSINTSVDSNGGGSNVSNHSSPIHSPSKLLDTSNRLLHTSSSSIHDNNNSSSSSVVDKVLSTTSLTRKDGEKLKNLKDNNTGNTVSNTNSSLFSIFSWKNTSTSTATTINTTTSNDNTTKAIADNDANIDQPTTEIDGKNMSIVQKTESNDKNDPTSTPVRIGNMYTDEASPSQKASSTTLKQDVTTHSNNTTSESDSVLLQLPPPLPPITNTVGTTSKPTTTESLSTSSMPEQLPQTTTISDVEIIKIPQIFPVLITALQTCKSIDVIQQSIKIILMSIDINVKTPLRNRIITPLSHQRIQQNIEIFFTQIKDWLSVVIHAIQYKRDKIMGILEEIHESSTSVGETTAEGGGESESVVGGGGGVPIRTSTNSIGNTNTIQGKNTIHMDKKLSTFSMKSDTTDSYDRYISDSSQTQTTISEEDHESISRSLYGDTASVIDCSESVFSFSTFTKKTKLISDRQLFIEQIETMYNKFVEPFYLLIDIILNIDMRMKPLPTRQYMELFNFSIPKYDDIQRVIMYNILKSLDNFPYTTRQYSTEIICYYLKNITIFLDSVYYKCDLILEFIVMVIKILHDITYKCTPEIRSKFKELGIIEIRHIYIVQCLMDCFDSHSRDLYDRVTALCEINSSLQGYIISTDTTKLISSSHVILYMLSIFIEAIEELEGVTIVESNFFHTHNNKELIEKVEMLINATYIIIAILQSCVAFSNDCKNVIRKLTKTIIGDQKNYVMTILLKSEPLSLPMSMSAAPTTTTTTTTSSSSFSFYMNSSNDYDTSTTNTTNTTTKASTIMNTEPSTIQVMTSARNRGGYSNNVEEERVPTPNYLFYPSSSSASTSTTVNTVNPSLSILTTSNNSTSTVTNVIPSDVTTITSSQSVVVSDQSPSVTLPITPSSAASVNNTTTTTTTTVSSSYWWGWGSSAPTSTTNATNTTTGLITPHISNSLDSQEKDLKSPPNTSNESTKSDITTMKTDTKATCNSTDTKSISVPTTPHSHVPETPQDTIRAQDIPDFLEWFCAPEQKRVFEEFKNRVIREIKPILRRMERNYDRNIQRKVKHIKTANDKMHKEKQSVDKIIRENKEKLKRVIEKCIQIYTTENQSQLDNIVANIKLGKTVLENELKVLLKSLQSSPTTSSLNTNTSNNNTTTTTTAAATVSNTSISPTNANTSTQRGTEVTLQDPMYSISEAVLSKVQDYYNMISGNFTLSHTLSLNTNTNTTTHAKYTTTAMMSNITSTSTSEEKQFKNIQNTNIMNIYPKIMELSTINTEKLSPLHIYEMLLYYLQLMRYTQTTTTTTSLSSESFNSTPTTPNVTTTMSATIMSDMKTSEKDTT